MEDSKVNKHRCFLAVKSQLLGMACKVYEIGILNKKGLMTSKILSEKGIIDNLDYLKARNSKGDNNYIRPHNEMNNSGLILLDDIEKSCFDELEKAGLKPCCMVETSPNNYQAWIRLSYQEIDPRLATQVSRLIAKSFHGDMNSADWKHYGRLSGFTNRKPQYCDGGLYPYVKCVYRKNEIAKNHKAALYKAVWKIIDIDEENKKNNDKIKSSSNNKHLKADPITTAQKYYVQMEQRNKNNDYSKFDFAVTARMIKDGFNKNQVLLAIKQSSPKIEERKKGHVSNYIDRTYENAYKAIIK